MCNNFIKLCFIILRKVKTQQKHKKRPVQCDLFLEKVSDGTCQKWFAKFQAGDFSLNDAPWLGRPVEVDSDQIEALTENNHYYTEWEIADILKISKS